MVAKPRTAVAFGLVLRLRVSKLKSVNSHRYRGGSWSRNAELGFVLRLRVSKVSTVTRIGGVVVAKRRTVVTFGLVLRLRVSKVSTVTGIGGVVVATRRAVVTFGFVSSHFQSVNSRRDRGGRGRETQNCRHFWPCLWREERREERGEKRDDRRDERREERREETRK